MDAPEPDADLESVLRFTAEAARDHAHRPYSGLAVGAAVEVELADGSRAVFGGCNVENASFGLTMCAERVAIGSAVAAGATRVLRVVVTVGGAAPLQPCGACRQVIAEFAAPEVEVLCLAEGGARSAHTLAELLPAAMGARDLERDGPADRDGG
jgi:cytidine deaminase